MGGVASFSELFALASTTNDVALEEALGTIALVTGGLAADGDGGPSPKELIGCLDDVNGLDGADATGARMLIGRGLPTI